MRLMTQKGSERSANGLESRNALAWKGEANEHRDIFWQYRLAGGTPP